MVDVESDESMKAEPSVLRQRFAGCFGWLFVGWDGVVVVGIIVGLGEHDRFLRLDIRRREGAPSRGSWGRSAKIWG